MGRLGLTSLGDHVAESSEESPMDISMDEEELMDCIHQAYSRTHEEQEDHPRRQGAEATTRKISRRNTEKVHKTKASSSLQKDRLEPPSSPLRIKFNFARTRLRAAQLHRAGQKFFPEASKYSRELYPTFQKVKCRRNGAFSICQ